MKNIEMSHIPYVRALTKTEQLAQAQNDYYLAQQRHMEVMLSDRDSPKGTQTAEYMQSAFLRLRQIETQQTLDFVNECSKLKYTLTRSE